ncbi:MAG TPA: endonuclease/exonuclease/phosphatase family protein [Acidimicrobiales bacterium]|nr:endonuclease/exonuclease/phosphatase family protein [Acidimicrobiales bacterium]
MRFVSWNVNHLEVWDDLQASGADVALLQEATPPRGSRYEVLPGASDTWATAGWEKRPWRTAIVRLADHIVLEPIVSGEISGSVPSALPISRSGTITAAKVLIDGRTAVIAVSIYAPWERYGGPQGVMWADGSAHRILSDLAPLLWHERHEPMLVAGDWNILRGYGEKGKEYNKKRYDTVFARAEALGLAFVGPEYPYGRQAEPWPEELPEKSICVPTFTPNRRPEAATRQLDFVFASKSIADRVAVRALNDPEQWGPSDHCRVVIDADL